AAGGEVAVRVDCGQSAPGRECADQIAMPVRSASRSVHCWTEAQTLRPRARFRPRRARQPDATLLPITAPQTGLRRTGQPLRLWRNREERLPASYPERSVSVAPAIFHPCHIRAV